VQIKILDCGIAKDMSAGATTVGDAGTICYKSPEWILGDEDECGNHAGTY
jgi:hypothetical protein